MSSSSFMKDLVQAQNCGTQNAASGFVSNIQQMQGKIGEARQFDGMVNGGPLANTSQNGMYSEMLQHGGPNVDAEAMLRSFGGSSSSSTAKMPQYMPQRQGPMPQRHAPHADPALMAAEFQRMQSQMRQQQPHMSQKQADDMIREFEQQFSMNAPTQQKSPTHMQPTHQQWANDFHKQHQHQQPPMQHQPQHFQQPAAQHFAAARDNYMMQQMHFSRMQQQMMPQPHHPFMHQPSMMQQQQQHVPISQQKATVELEDMYGEAESESKTFESAFKEGEANNEQQQAPAEQTGIGGLDKDMLDKLMNSDDPKWRNSKFLKFINKISTGQIEFRDNQAIEKPGAEATANGDWASEFASKPPEAAAKNWSDEFQQGQQQQPPGASQADWEREFAERETDWAEMFANQQDAAEDDAKNDDVLDWNDDQVNEWAKEYSKDIETEWKMKNWMSEFQQMSSEANAQLNAEQRYNDPEYSFAEQNQYQQDRSAYERGIELLQRGELKQAILAFEAAVQQEPEHADAWCYLGQAAAENEDETNAISALLKAVSIDPYNLRALMMLGVSYTNDLEEHRALNYLKTWLLNNPDYQHADVLRHKQSIAQYEHMYGSDAQNQQGPIVDVTLHDEVTRMFLAAVNVNANDPELHTVLGVLYHITGDFDKAIDEFKRGLALRPDDAQLWNKLGATQANSSRSNEAVNAYKRALELRPSYVRALANLAISYANQGMHEEAVRQYLLTLSHNPDANHIWSYLRISLSHMGRDDLVELTKQKNVNAFKQYFQF